MLTQRPYQNPALLSKSVLAATLNPAAMETLTIETLLQQGTHFGHQTSKWHPSMKPFIFTSRNGIHIIDLERTVQAVTKASDFAKECVAAGGTVLFVGTKRQAKPIVKKYAEQCRAPYFTERWLGGFLTNFGVVSKIIERLKTLTEDRDAGRLSKYTKKERLQFNREIVKLEKIVGGVRNVTRPPSALFVVDLKTEATAVREARKVGCPVIGIADTNANISGIAYPIPGNDDATKSIDLITGIIADAVTDGVASANARAEQSKPEGVA